MFIVTDYLYCNIVHSCLQSLKQIKEIINQFLIFDIFVQMILQTLSLNLISARILVIFTTTFKLLLF